MNHFLAEIGIHHPQFRARAIGIPTADVSNDQQLQLLISQNSEAIAVECNRIFAREKVEETWRCVAPVCCPDGTCRIWLSHFPVYDSDIERVESPRGNPIDVQDYDLEPPSGNLILIKRC